MTDTTPGGMSRGVTNTGAPVSASRPTSSRRGLTGDGAWLAVVGTLTVLVLVALSSEDRVLSLALAEYRGGAFGRFIEDRGRDPAKLLTVVSAFVLASRTHRLRWPLAARAAAATLTQLVLHPAILTNALKVLSGRTRPIRVGLEGEAFTPFYVWTPRLGDLSFPSGHVAIAMVLAPCVVLLWRVRRRGAAVALAVVTAAWAGTVALGRVCSGAHFPTDVVCSIGLGVALAPLSLRLGDALLRRAGLAPA